MSQGSDFEALCREQAARIVALLREPTLKHWLRFWEPRPRDPELRKILRYPNATVSGDHFVLPVAVNHRHKLQGIVHRTSPTGETVYIEPAGIANLSAEQSVLKSEEEREIHRILRRLTAEVGRVARPLTIAIDIMGRLERFLLLQTIDERWREHLLDMDYLREGIHLRGFAQIDPLVAYKNEGFAMFEELMHSVWEEFSKLVFRAQIEVDPSQLGGAFGGNGGGAPTALDYSGGTPEAQPSALQEVAAGAGAVGTAAGAMGPNGGGNGAPSPEVIETVVKDERENIGRNDPCWCGSGKKFKKCHGA